MAQALVSGKVTKVTPPDDDLASSRCSTVEVAVACNRKDLFFFEKQRRNQKKRLYFVASLITATLKANELP